jgi:peptidoglycan/LPS O-acetylase OafA/YrhL
MGRAVTAYDPTEWHDLFVATAGASAALAGLVFVAVSINIERILKYPGLPERALETILLLLGALLVSIVGLIPAQSHVALGVELLLVSLAIGGVIAALPATHATEEPEPRSWLLSRWAVRLAGTVPLILGGVSVLVSSGGGLYWIAGGIVFAIVGAVSNAWVLLVEILR